MTTIVTRQTGPYAKGSPLTNTELDNNFINLNDYKVDTSGGVITGDLTINGQANVHQRLAVGTGAYTLLPNLIAQFTGTSDIYSQVNQQNLDPHGTGDFVITASNGTDTINYLDLGMSGFTYANTNYNSWQFVWPNDGYLMLMGNPGQDQGGNLYIGTAGSGSVQEIGDIVFIQGSDTHEVGRWVLGQGLVIETNTPSVSNSSGSLVVQGGIGANGAIRGDSVYDSGIRVLTYAQGANTFLQANDVITLTAAKSYTDTANTFLQGEISANAVIAKSYTDTANTFLQANDAITLTAAKSYADTNISANAVIAKSYTDTANTFLQAFLQANDASTLTASKSYTDSANTVIQNQISFLQNINNAQNTNISGASTLAQNAYNAANTKLSTSGGTLNGSLSIIGDLTASGNISFTGNVTSFMITGNTGEFFGYASNGFNALYAGLPTVYEILPNEVAEFAGANNSYIQINFHNENGGSGATTDWIATANNGTDSTYFVDMGIAGNGYVNSNPYNSLGTSLYPNDSYLYAQGNTTGSPWSPGGNLVVGTASTGTNIKLMAGGVNSQNVVVTITPSSVTLAQPIIFSDSTSQTTAAVPATYSTASFNKANGAVQTGFTTISANGVSITPSSNTDTFTITAATANGINVLNPSSKTIDIGLRASGVTAKTYGDASNIPAITVDQFGRVTSVSNTAVSIPPGTSIVANSGQITANASTGIVALGLATSGVTAKTYGSATNIPVITVDTYGRLTAVANASVSTTYNLSGNTGSGSVSGGGTLTLTGGPGITTAVSGSTVTVTNSGVISLSTGSSSRITVSSANGSPSIDLATIAGLSAGTYSYPSLQVDSYGRIVTITSQTPITSISNTAPINVTTAAGVATISMASSGAAVGTYGGTTNVATITVDTYGRITSVTNTAIVTGATISDDSANNVSYYPLFSTVNSGTLTNVRTSSNKLTYTPSSGLLSTATANITSGTASTTSNTGALVVNGGVGVTGSLYVGQALHLANNNTGVASAFYIEYNAVNNSVDFIFG